MWSFKIRVNKMKVIYLLIKQILIYSLLLYIFLKINTKYGADRALIALLISILLSISNNTRLIINKLDFYFGENKKKRKINIYQVLKGIIHITWNKEQRFLNKIFKIKKKENGKRTKLTKA